MQREWRALAAAEILNVVLAAHLESIEENLLLQRSGIVYLFLHTHIYFFPEARYRTHTRGMRLAHGLLDFFRISVDNELCALAQGEESPSTFKDVRERKEIDDPVFLCKRHTFIIGLKGCSKLTIG